MWYGQTGVFPNYLTLARTTGNVTTIAISMTTAAQAYLEFYYRGGTQTGSDVDQCYVHVTNDSIRWDTLFQKNIDKNDWWRTVLNLSRYVGNSSVKIRFEFDTIVNYGYNDDGWLIDDVKVFTEYTPTPPSVPSLSNLGFSTDRDGIIELSINDVDAFTVKCHIYRDTATILSVDGMSPINTTTIANLYVVDPIGIDNTYYYVVTAESEEGINSSFSTNLQITVAKGAPATPPNLNYITSPSTSGYVDLGWFAVRDANIYYGYRNTAEITSVVGLNPVFSLPKFSSLFIDPCNATDFAPTNGLFYYAIVAGNAYGNGTPSNNLPTTVAVSAQNAPILNVISPNPSINGSISLSWSFVYTATTYFVYRETDPITSAVGLTPIATTSALNYQDIVTSDDTYYYAVVGGNQFWNTSTSLNQSVIFAHAGPVAPSLNSITPSPNTNGSISLRWNSVPGAGMYYVYRDDDHIGSISGLTPIISTTTGTIQDSIGTDGTYHYVVVAGNLYGNSTPSNEQDIEVAISPLSAPSLTPIWPQYDPDGIIALSWTTVTDATSYYVFRDTAAISSILGRTPLIETPSLSYSDNVETSFGTYYYVVAAHNAGKNSSASICRNVVVPPPPENYTMVVGASYEWVEPSAGGTQLYLGDDGVSAQW